MYRNYTPTWKGSQLDLSYLRSTRTSVQDTPQILSSSLSNLIWESALLSDSFGESSDLDERWYGTGVLWLYLLYLRAYISGAIVSRSSVGAEREIDVVTLALQPAVFIPCCADAVGNRHFRIARHSQEIYLQFSLAVFRSRSVVRLEVPYNSQEEIERWVFTMSLKYLTLKFQWFRRYASGLSSRFFILFTLLLRRFRLSLQSGK